MKFGWKTRIGLVLSAVWLILAFLFADDDHHFGQVLGLGILPLVILWGITWAIAGWRSQRPPKQAMPEASLLEAKRKRSLRFRTFAAVLAVLTIGLCTATWQFHAADNEAGTHVVAYWFGEWLVYGLLAYAVLRFFRRIPRGSPAVLAAILVVAGVNYKTHSAITEDRQARMSLAKAAPLVTKILSGVQVSDQDIKAAQVGMMEPLLLAQAAFGREVIAIGNKYVNGVSALQPELMLAPASLASSNVRFQTRSKLKLSQQITAEYKNEMENAVARTKLRILATQAQVPAAMAEGAMAGFENRSAQISSYVSSIVDSERDAGHAITAILDLMDANPDGYVVDKGPPPNLLFRDDAILARYRELVTAVLDASRKAKEADARQAKDQLALTDKLTDLLKR
jgi:hypothetical protein